MGLDFMAPHRVRSGGAAVCRGKKNHAFLGGAASNCETRTMVGLSWWPLAARGRTLRTGHARRAQCRHGGWPFRLAAPRHTSWAAETRGAGAVGRACAASTAATSAGLAASSSTLLPAWMPASASVVESASVAAATHIRAGKGGGSLATGAGGVAKVGRDEEGQRRGSEVWLTPPHL